MTIAKHLILCLGFSLLLVACNNNENLPIDDPALTANEPPTDTQETDPCKMIPDPGPCKAAIEQYFFDQKALRCSTFTYGGCQGTVPFDTMESCKSLCESEVVATDNR